MQLTPHVHALKIPFQITLSPGCIVPRYVYQYIIAGERIVLVDTGVSGAESILWDYFQRQGWSWSDLSTIILTHSHPDHIGAALPIQEKSGCSVLCHPAERNWIEDVELQQRQRPVPGFADLVAGSVRTAGLLSDDDIVECAGHLDLQVIHTPGHSAGSISLFLRAEGVLLTGDAVPQPGSMPIYDDVAASARSIRRLMSLPGIDMLLSSWDEPRSGAEAYQALNAGLDYLRAIHKSVLRSRSGKDSVDLQQLCRRVVDDLGLPSFAANPLVSRSLAAHLREENEAELESLFSA
jgi:glyoxylase-like metal-dependent hydrolase (beta-lactamase superfamily II)